MGNEFDERGFSSALNMMCNKNSVCGKNKISIIDGSSHDKVTKIEDEDTNLALSKMVFANMILEKKDPFNDIDFSNFVKIFIILKEIYNEK